MNTPDMKKIIGSAAIFSILLPLAAFAQEGNPGVMSTVPYNGSCASAAVIAQENSMQSIRDTQGTAMKAASATRRDALAAAYLLTDATQRDTALKAARDAFQTTQKAADQAAQASEKTLADGFKTTMQGCGVMLPPQGQNGKEGGRDNGNDGKPSMHEGDKNRPDFAPGEDQAVTGTDNATGTARIARPAKKDTHKKEMAKPAKKARSKNRKNN